MDAAIAAVYQHTLDMVFVEIEGETAGPPRFWRKLVCDAARESGGIEDKPDESSRNKTEWELVVECLMDDVLWDRDFEIEEHLDAENASATAFKGVMGVAQNYFAALPLDPPPMTSSNVIWTH